MTKITVIIQLILFGVLLWTLFYISFHKKITTLPKWVIAVCAIAILAMADKFKLIAALGLVGVVYLIKYFHPKKHQHGTKHNWKLDS